MRPVFDRFVIGAGLMVLLVATACSRPTRSENFVVSDGSGVYTFELDLSDSLSMYDLSFYASTDSYKCPRSFPLTIHLISPSGTTYAESLFYDTSAGFLVPYRKGLTPVEYGVWTLELRTFVDGLMGLGVVCDKVEKEASDSED